MQFLLDTSTCISILKQNRSVIQRLALHAPSECACSSISAYELFTGVEKCRHPALERAKVELMLRTIPEAPFDMEASREAARIRAHLERIGQPIGPYDTLLAGHAAAKGYILVTDNLREFNRVPGLVVESWS